MTRIGVILGSTRPGRRGEPVARWVMREWAATIGRFDGFVFVTPEYNHSTSGVLKNAVDFLYPEWNNKAMGVVSYGLAGGARAAEHFRLVAGELQMADAA